MRQLSPAARRAAQRGITLIELMIAFAILSMLAMTAAPYFGDYSTNSRLRESGNLLYAETLFAQSEAIKRNRIVRVAASGNTVTVTDQSDPENPVTLRTRTLAEGVTASSGGISFGSQGWPQDMVAGSIDLSHTHATCSADHRCPGLRVEAGGAVRLCSNRLANCS